MSESSPDPGAVARLVSDNEREQAVTRLTAAFASDAIAVDEFERRVAEVYRAESATALRAITRDLPEPAAGAAPLPAVVDQPTGVARRPSQQIGSVLSSVERSVDGPMPERLDIRSVVGSLELDLRRADFPPGVTEIRFNAILGNIEIELPRHVRVEDEGQTFLGNLSVRGRTRSERSDDTPVVRIIGRSILANVEIELDD